MKVLKKISPVPIADNRLGAKVRSIRLDNGLTIQNLADMIGCSSTHLTRIELGKRKVLNYELLMNCAAVLRIPFTELLELAIPEITVDKGLRTVFPCINTAEEEDAITSIIYAISKSNLTLDDLHEIVKIVSAYTEYVSCDNDLAEISEDADEDTQSDT